MKARKIDHVGIVVTSLEDGLRTFEHHFDLSRDTSRGGELPALGIKNAYITVGDSDLEFIEPVSEEGPVARFAAERGEGQFLLSIEVDDLAAAVEHLRQAGARVGDPANGVAFVSTRSTHGVNLQLVQRA